ncbi:GerAB/ArcD/ProY family transporter [Neobacillus sp. LXY-1]|uniref:GerAB/ArcD/ProY family transporter n=1 Tax=Neobacillus sp. LXY-1 TaxID=3379133 RepID=UPI003EE3CD48
MQKENISLSQLLTLLINFLLGSAVVVGVGTEAKNDAWIAIFLGGWLGFGVLYFYHFLMSRLDTENLFQLFEYCIGRKATILLSFLYVIYFLYISSVVVRDFGELIASAIMPNTPIEIISLTFSLLMAYVIYLGIEVLARTSEIFTPYVLLFFILLTIFLFVSGNVHFHQIQPILCEGWKPALKTSFKLLIFFPYGEMIVFTVSLTIKGDPEKGGNVNNMNDVTPKALVVLDSLAIFKKDRLKGFLPLSGARNYLIIVDKLKKTVVSVPCGKNKYFGIRIYNSKTRTSAKLIKGIPVINLKIRTEAYLDGMQCEDDLTSLDTYDKFEKKSEQQLKHNLESTINKMQNKYKLDIFGFGEALYRQDYQNFKKVKNKWDQVFQHAIVHVDIKVQLRRSGIRTKSLILK